MEVHKITTTQQVVGHICDMCSRECPHNEYAILTAEWGYYSNNKDLTTNESHLCENCFDKVKDFIDSQGGRVRTLESGTRVADIDFITIEENDLV